MRKFIETSIQMFESERIWLSVVRSSLTFPCAKNFNYIIDKLELGVGYLQTEEFAQYILCLNWARQL